MKTKVSKYASQYCVAFTGVFSHVRLCTLLHTVPHAPCLVRICGVFICRESFVLVSPRVI